MITKFNDKDIDSPFLQFLLTLFAATVLTFVLCMFVVAVMVAIVLLPIWLPLDYVLKHYGRKGFIIHHDDGKISIKLGPEGFTRGV